MPILVMLASAAGPLPTEHCLDALRYAPWLFLADAPFRWRDPHTWPWFLNVWLAFALLGWLKPAWVWFRRQQAKSWPTASAHIDSTYIAEPRRFLGLALQPHRSRTYDPVLAYSYTLSGNTFRGEYRRQYGSEQEANEFLRGLAGQHFAVQYDSSRPARSVLLEETVEAMLRNRPPASAKAASLLDTLPAWLRPLLGVLAFVSLLGFVLSFIVHVAALSDRRVLPDYFFAVLHAGIFAVFFPAMFLARKRIAGATRKNFWKSVTKGAPDGLRYMLYLLSAYAFVVEVQLFIRMPPGVAPKGLSPVFSWQQFSCVWMVFYWASFTILTAAMNEARQRSIYAAPGN